MFISASLGISHQESYPEYRELAEDWGCCFGGSGNSGGKYQSIHRWFERFSETGGDTSLHINPVAFQEAGIDRVPALSLQINGKTEMTALRATEHVKLIESMY